MVLYTLTHKEDVKELKHIITNLKIKLSFKSFVCYITKPLMENRYDLIKIDVLQQ